MTLTVTPRVAPAFLGIPHPWEGKMEWGRGERGNKIITTIIKQDRGPTWTTDGDVAQIRAGLTQSSELRPRTCAHHPTKKYWFSNSTTTQPEEATELSVASVIPSWTW